MGRKSRKRSTNSSAKESAISSGVLTRPGLENRKRCRKSECTSLQSSKNSCGCGDVDLVQDGLTANSSNAATNVPNPMSEEVRNAPNMIPEFNPSIEKSRIDIWLSKVNECAEHYGWDEEHTIHYALSKLRGSSKVWLQGQTSVLHSWARWQGLLCKAFPLNTDYAELLTIMLDRRLKFGEDLEEYYYDKMALLYSCDIDGDRAVDCIIHGIEDFSVRAIATATQCPEPEPLLYLLKDIYYEQRYTKNRWCI